MATKVVKVKAHKRLDGTGKIENVDAHLRKIEKFAVGKKMLYKPTGEVARIIDNYGNAKIGDLGEVRTDLEGNTSTNMLRDLPKRFKLKK